MKKKVLKNSNGIVICDSIIMSVKRKRLNLRNLEAVAIAAAGFVSAIMAFLSMFDFSYSIPAVVFAAFAFSALYITLSLIGKKGVWIAAFTAIPVLVVCFKLIDTLAVGYKFIYNRIYSTSYHTDIAYYKFLQPDQEKLSVTAFFILCIWLLAIVIYTFTIYRPNSIPPLLVTFPLVEVGLYNGMKISVLWGMLLVAYWLALFAMTTIDIGEYSGGSGGFVRKDNLFFPKRQMKLKVTEQCGIFVIAEIIFITAATCAAMKLCDYKRSDEINRKRVEVREAVNSFSMDNFADSISNITSAFGFTFKSETHKLGNVDKLRYKDTTDMTVTVDKKFDGAIYLKEYTGSVYSDNKWTAFSDSAYNEPVFSDFENYSIYPQDFPYIFNKVISGSRDDEFTIWINSKLRGNRSFAPYGTDSIGIVTYNHDSDVSSKKQSGNEFSYKFSAVSPGMAAPALKSPMRSVYYSGNISDREWLDTITSYAENHELMTSSHYFTVDSELSADIQYMSDNPDKLLAMLIQEDYENFVYDHYLQLPDNSDISEIRAEFADILGNGDRNMTAADKLFLMENLRAEVNSRTEYSLNPGRTPNNRDFVNYFLLENKKGYCTHFATTGVLLARMAGIPARYATGYVIVGDDFNNDNRNPSGTFTIDIKDNRSHAWVEIYLNGYGWIPYEFTAGYSAQSIDTTPTTSATSTSNNTETTTADSTERETRTSSSKRAPSGTTTTAARTTQASTAVTGVGTGSGGSSVEKGFHIPESVKYTIYSVLLLGMAVCIILLRRSLILHLRRKRFSQGDSVSRMRYIYGFCEKLLGLNGIYRDEQSRMDFAEKTDRILSGRFFDEGSFIACTDAALRAAFSEDIPSKEEVDKCRDFALGFANKLYESSGSLRKLYLRFINVII